MCLPRNDQVATVTDYDDNENLLGSKFCLVISDYQDYLQHENAYFTLIASNAAEFKQELLDFGWKLIFKNKELTLTHENIDHIVVKFIAMLSQIKNSGTWDNETIFNFLLKKYKFKDPERSLNLINFIAERCKPETFARILNFLFNLECKTVSKEKLKDALKWGDANWVKLDERGIDHIVDIHYQTMRVCVLNPVNEGLYPAAYKPKRNIKMEPEVTIEEPEVEKKDDDSKNKIYSQNFEIYLQICRLEQEQFYIDNLFLRNDTDALTQVLLFPSNVITKTSIDYIQYLLEEKKYLEHKNRHSTQEKNSALTEKYPDKFIERQFSVFKTNNFRRKKHDEDAHVNKRMNKLMNNLRKS